MKDLRSRGGIAVRAGSKAEKILLENNAWTLTGTSQVYSCGTFKLAEIAFIKSFNRINGERRYNGLIRFTARIKPLYRLKQPEDLLGSGSHIVFCSGRIHSLRKCADIS